MSCKNCERLRGREIRLVCALNDCRDELETEPHSCEELNCPGGPCRRCEVLREASNAIRAYEPETSQSTHEGLKCPPGECAVRAGQTTEAVTDARQEAGAVDHQSAPGAGTGGQAGREPSPMPEVRRFTVSEVGHAWDLMLRLNPYLFNAPGEPWKEALRRALEEVAK